MIHHVLAGDAARQARRLPGARRSSKQPARVDLPPTCTLRLPGGAVRYGAVVEREVNGRRDIGLVPRRAADRKRAGTLYVPAERLLILEEI